MTKGYKELIAIFDQILPMIDFLLKKNEEDIEKFQDNRFIFVFINVG